MNREELEKILCDVLEIPRTNKMIDSQISKFKKQHGYSYKEIGRAVYYYVKVLGKDFEIRKYGIGLVPNIMDDANAYFVLEKVKLNKIEKAVKALLEEKDFKTIKVTPKRKKRGVNKINIKDI